MYIMRSLIKSRKLHILKMRKRVLLIFIVIGVLFLIQAISCNKNQTPVGPTVIDTMPCPDTVETLPPKTHKGLNTAGCLVNGEVWVAKNEEYFDTPPEEMPPNKFHYGNLGNNPNNPIFKMQFWRRFSNICDTAISFIGGNALNVKINQKMPIPTRYVFFDGYNCGRFEKLPDKEHYIIIDHLDTIDQIISGRFAFTAVNLCPTPDTVDITDGRFDVQYEGFE